MNRAKELHRRSMDLVDRAASEKKGGSQELAKLTLLEAFRLEMEAADVLRSDFVSEPSRSVLYRSAASLAMQCELYDEGEKLLYKALAGEPPKWIVPELTELLDQVSFHRHLKLSGVELTNVDVQVVLEGPAIGPGIAPTSEVTHRVEGTNLLLFRTAERLANRTYRETGPPTNDIRDQAQSFITIPRAASYAFSLRIGRMSQMSFEDPSEGVLDEFLDCLELLEKGDEAELKIRISESAYYNNFVALGKALLPDGHAVRTVGFTVRKANFTRELALRNTSANLQKQFAPERSGSTGRVTTGKETRVEVTGQLKLADAMREDISRISLITTGGRVTIYVPEGLMADIVKPLWDEWVTIDGIKMGRTITLVSIRRALL